jgi:hypothetical protein
LLKKPVEVEVEKRPVAVGKRPVEMLEIGRLKLSKLNFFFAVFIPK